MKLNVGCGPNYRDGYINIDACNLFKVDVVMKIPDEKLTERFGIHVADEVEADDVLEHLFRWDGVTFIQDCYWVLKPGGILILKTPCLRAIIRSSISEQRKMDLIRGYQGQHINGQPTGVLLEAWKARPDLFTHRYTWDENELSSILSKEGFSVESIGWNDSNSMTVRAFNGPVSQVAGAQ